MPTKKKTQPTENVQPEADAAETAAGAMDAAKEGFAGISDLFKLITVPDVVVIRDRWGVSYDVSPYLSMRQELVCAGMLDDILTGEQLPVKLFEEAQALVNDGNTLGGLRHFMRGAVLDPSMHHHVDALLEVVLEDLLVDIREAAKERGAKRTEPMDLLSSGDVVQALGFFFARSATAIAEAMQSLIGAAAA